MAGGGGGMAVSKSKRGKASKRKKMKRVGFHLDMTPLVDITFLLLTFFMFTTSMASPQILDMKLPPEAKPVKVDEKKLLDLFLRDDNKLFYRTGSASETPIPIELKNVRAMSEKMNIEFKNDCIVALKVQEGATYGTVVKILDELNIAETKITQEISKLPGKDGKPMERKRKFALVPLPPEELEKIKEL